MIKIKRGKLRSKLKRMFQVAMKYNKGRKKKDPLKIFPLVSIGAFGKRHNIPIIKYFRDKPVKKVFKYKKGEMRRNNIS